MSHKYKADITHPDQTVESVLDDLLTRWNMNDEEGRPNYVVMTPETLCHARMEWLSNGSSLVEYFAGPWTVFGIPIAVLECLNKQQRNFLELVK